ncbi:tetratricopeptide repeat protein [Chloroflexota bacterium]
MLRLSPVSPNEWEFVYPEEYHRVMDQFHRGCESYEQGSGGEAESIFKAVLAQVPYHLDAIHHLAIVQQEQGLIGHAKDLWEQSVRIGRQTFPPDFEVGRDRLEWGWLENRPFLRCLHGLALAKYENGEVEEALVLFRELLSLNPNDNQGIRALAVEALFELGRWEEACKIAGQYPDDMMAEILYGRALALFKLGRRREATLALKKAVRHSPRVGNELLKTRHQRPKPGRQDMMMVGGSDEAYYYYERSGRFWKSAPESLEWLRRTARPRPFPKGNTPYP